MVLLNVKRGEDTRFLYSTSIDATVDEVVADIVAIYNGQLKVERICYELEELGKHGTFLPAEMQGLTDEQITELKLVDPWAEKCSPPDHVMNKDPMGRRCGRAPQPKLREVFTKAAETAKGYVCKKLALNGTCLTQKDVGKALDELKGATKIVFPGGLPPHDPVRQELENVEELAGTQASLEVIDPTRACLWACGKQFQRGNLLKDHIGRNDKCKIVVKLCKSSEGPPGREPVLTEEQRKELMLHAYRKQEEWKKLEADEDDAFLDSSWADPGNMKRQFHGMNDIKWKPK